MINHAVLHRKLIWCSPMPLLQKSIHDRSIRHAHQIATAQRIPA
jgi:hypothetical protein